MAIERKTAFIRFGPPDESAIIGFLLWNDRKASLRFGGTSNSEFDEFLLHFPSEETFQPRPGKLRFFIKLSLAYRI